MNSQEIKVQSKKLKEIAKKFGYQIKHSHALEILSYLYNGTHWHLSSLTKDWCFPVGIKGLDSDLMGGLNRGTLTSIVGGANIGKTMFAVSIICNILRKKKKVLIYQLEGMKDEMRLRILSNLSGVEYGKLLDYEEKLTDDEKRKINKAKYDIMEKFLVIKEEMKFDYTIEELSESIFSTRMDFKFDILLVDSGQLLSTKNNNMNYPKMMGKIFKQFKNIARAYDCAVISPVQATTASEAKELIKCEDIAESFDIARISTNVLTLNMTDKEREEGFLRIYVAKAYGGLNGSVYKQKTNFSICNLISG